MNQTINPRYEEIPVPLGKHVAVQREDWKRAIELLHSKFPEAHAALAEVLLENGCVEFEVQS